jgi:hypothetical protein
MRETPTSASASAITETALQTPQSGSEGEAKD